MAKVVARTKAKGKHFEIRVDFEEAMKVKNGKGDIVSALESPSVYYDINKGTAVSQSDLQEAFGSSNIYEVAKRIIMDGEIQKPQEFRDLEREEKKKQVLNLILRNAVDQHGRPYTEERLKSAIEEIHYNFDNRPAEQQMHNVIHKLKEKIPIKIEVKKIKLTIPAQYTGQVYGLINNYKESEEWLANGSLEAVLAIPSGLLLDFFDKINGMTHGAVQSEEIKE